MNRIFVDQDGPLADFEGYAESIGLKGSPLVKRMPGTYLKLRPTPGGIEAVRELIALGYDVWIATRPPTGTAQAYADKVTWLLELLPELSHRIIITPDKGLLGDEHDYLIDDMPHKANCLLFRGRLIVYGSGCEWPEIMEMFRQSSQIQQQDDDEALNRFYDLLFSNDADRTDAEREAGLRKIEEIADNIRSRKRLLGTE
jgi:hypothetical protein